ncbi:hypothetical protein [Streptomyces sp. LN245]|uniref:hypothetical protein n=1 Tax=Streptomyces sp. LN245 TaxID=3112975 RepID=UPI00371CA175
MCTGSPLRTEFGGRSSKEFARFSALAGAPVVSIDAERAAEHILRALEQRRTRLVLTPAARAAPVAPITVTRLSGFAARLLAHAPGSEGDADGPAGGGIAHGHGIAVPPIR